MIKWDSETYVELFKDYPNYEMELSGWEWSVKYYLFGLIPIVIYRKPLIR